MLVIRVALSDPNKTEERALWFDAHKAHLRAGGVHIVQSGPFRGADGAPLGALIIAQVSGLAEFEHFSAGDPFVKSGVYGEVHIAEWTVTLDNVPS
jgi:uncharacterized protein YciI